MFSPSNTRTLYPYVMETLSSQSLPLQFHYQQKRRLATSVKVAWLGPTGCSIYKPWLPQHNDSGEREIAIPRSKTTNEWTKKVGSKGVNIDNTSSDVLCLMDSLGFTVTPDIYASLIDECTNKGDASRALELWAHMEWNKPMMRFLSKPNRLLFINRILMMLMSCGCVDTAFQLFDKMSVRESVAWCLMIAGLVDNSLHFQALDLFSQMMLYPLNHQNDAALETLFACILKACVHDMNIDMGRTIHGWAIKLGYTRSLYVSTAIVDFYGKFRCPRESNIIFHDQIQDGAGDTVLWTGALASNCRENHFEETVHMFRDMGRAGIQKNEFTLSSVLKACGRVQDGGLCGQQAHAEAIKLGLVDSHVFVQCSLVDMYAKCGKLLDARKVFDTISCDTKKQSTPCWNAMINGYIENGVYVEAIKILYQMKAAGVEPPESLLGRVRIACGTRSLERQNC